MDPSNAVGLVGGALDDFSVCVWSGFTGQPQSRGRENKPPPPNRLDSEKGVEAPPVPPLRWFLPGPEETPGVDDWCR